MQVWNFEVVQNGKQQKGKLEAKTRDEALKYLQDQGMTVLKIEESFNLSLKNLANFQIGGIPLKEKVIFLKQIATMVNAGLPIVQALEILISQVKNPNLKDTLEKVLGDVKSGSTLSNSFAKYPSLFDEVEINLLRVGESSGNLVEMVTKIAADADKKNILTGKVTGALIYPAIIFVLMIVVAVAMLIGLIPQVASTFETFDAELPLITRVIIAISDFINPAKSYGGIVLLILSVFGFFSLIAYRKTVSGRKVTDQIILKIPLIGGIIALSNLEEFCRILSMLLTSGVPIVEAIKVTSNAMTNVLYQEAVLAAVPSVEKGLPLANVFLSNTTLFPPILTRMIITGEESGKLDKVLKDMSTFYETELDQITNNLTKILEPVMLIAVGGMVGLMLLAIYIPIFSLAEVIS